MIETAAQAVDWEQRYRDGNTPWERPSLNPAFLDWRETGALTPCRILVPGAGRSAEPAALAEAGFDVTVLDVAESAIAVQTELLAGRGAVVQADLFRWTPAVPFDAIYDQTCLCAVSPRLWGDYAACLAGWLQPGGLLFVLFMQTGVPGGPPYHCDLDAMRALFARALWVWPDALPSPVPHLALGRSEQPAILQRR